MSPILRAQLIEPDGTIGLIMSIESAIEYCKTHSGWTWCFVYDEL